MMARTMVLTAVALAALTSAQAQDYEASDEARRIARDAIIVDGHVDVPYRVARSGEDVGAPTEEGDFDVERARAGGLDVPFMSIYVAAEYQETGGAKAQADRLIGLIEGLVAMHPDDFVIAKSVGDVRAAKRAGKIALPLGMENGAPIEGDLENLRHFYDRGIRYVTLTHSKVNHLSDSSYDEERRWGGLSPFGRLAVAKMNDLGVMVDISHLSDDAANDVLDITRAPVIASHSSARALTPGFERNMSDEMIRRLAENGGVIMINFGSSFLANDWGEWRDAAQAAYAEHLEAEGIEDTEEAMDAFAERYEETRPRPFATLDDVLDHVGHVTDLVGVEHVGLGSDYDGVGDSLPTGLKDVSAYPNLIEGLLQRGYTEDEVVLILGENALRVWADAERAARPGR